MIFNNITIISGGQSGVDRAALDFALKYHIPCGGWCPKGRIAEDGAIDLKYPLKETITSKYEQRTKKNVEDSDATLIIIQNTSDKGTLLTKLLAKDKNKPILEVNLSGDIRTLINQFKIWVNDNNITRLNIAGPRESSSQGIYKSALSFLEELINGV